MRPLRAALHWCRRHLAWSNSPQAWGERLGTLGLLLAAAALLWYGGGLPVAARVALGGGLLVLAAVLLRRGWLKLFGPVLFYDMVRSARRGRYVLLRFAYACLLFLLLVIVFFNVWQQYARVGGVTQREAAAFAQGYFYTFMTAQVVVVLLLTPAYVAGAITEEKSKKTLEFLLATDLANREIVLGKLAARLANLTLFVLTGLPILSCVQFLGGVDPNLVLAGFAFTGLTMFGLAGLGILCSVWYKESRDAIAITYLIGIGYYALSLLLLAWSAGYPGVMALSAGVGPYTLSVGDLVDAAQAGNLFLVLNRLGTAAALGTLDTTLPAVLGRYALFQGAVGLGGAAWATWRLRALALGDKSRRRFRFRVWPRRKSGVWRDAMLWKEVEAEGSLRLHWLGRIICALLVVGSFTPLAMILWNHLAVRNFDRTFPELVGHTAAWLGLSLPVVGTLLAVALAGGGYRWPPAGWLRLAALLACTVLPLGAGVYFHLTHAFAIDRWGGWRTFGEEVGVWVRVMTGLVGTVFLLGVAVRASNCVSRERDRQTLDSLLTTPLSGQHILFAKWLGNVLGLRVILYWLAAVWALGMMFGGLSPFALPFLLGALAVYAGAVSLLGCWCSLEAPTSLRATLYTLLLAGGLTTVHWLPWFCCAAFLVGTPMRNLEYVAMFQVGLTPPIALGVLPWRVQDFTRNGPGEFPQFYLMTLLGMAVWGFAALVGWAGVLTRFEEVTHRVLYPPPRLPRRPPAPDSWGGPPPVEPLPDGGPVGAVLVEETWDPVEVPDDEPPPAEGPRPS